VPAAPRSQLDDDDERDLADYHAAMDGTQGYLLHEALRAVWRTVARANEYVDRQAPWRLAKDPERRDDLESVLASLIRSLTRQAVYLSPFMPGKATELWSQLGAPGDPASLRFDSLGTLDPAGWQVRKGEGLFPKSS
jgi:methionyl-tRNA synthetase